jgi:hypothetical protein
MRPWACPLSGPGARRRAPRAARRLGHSVTPPHASRTVEDRKTFLDMGQCIARAANCKRRLLEISMLFLKLFILGSKKRQSKFLRCARALF